MLRSLSAYYLPEKINWPIGSYRPGENKLGLDPESALDVCQNILPLNSTGRKVCWDMKQGISSFPGETEKYKEKKTKTNRRDKVRDGRGRSKSKELLT